MRNWLTQLRRLESKIRGEGQQVGVTGELMVQVKSRSIPGHADIREPTPAGERREGAASGPITDPETQARAF